MDRPERDFLRSQFRRITRGANTVTLLRAHVLRRFRRNAIARKICRPGGCRGSGRRSRQHAAIIFASASPVLASTIRDAPNALV